MELDIDSRPGAAAALSRRRFLARAGLGGAAITVGGAVLPLRNLLGSAAAQETEFTAGDLIAFAETIELAWAAAYDGMLASGHLQPAAAQTVTTFQTHHRQHAARLAPLAGATRTGQANEDLLQALTDHISQATDEAGVLAVASDIENAAPSTYLALIAAIDEAPMVQLAASILVSESQHAVVIGQAVDAPLADLVTADGFETQNRAVTVERFPHVVVEEM